jgi:hypothetical protein
MLTHCYCNCTVNPLILSPARSGALVCKGRSARHRAALALPGLLLGSGGLLGWWRRRQKVA